MFGIPVANTTSSSTIVIAVVVAVLDICGVSRSPTLPFSGILVNAEMVVTFVVTEIDSIRLILLLLLLLSASISIDDIALSSSPCFE